HCGKDKFVIKKLKCTRNTENSNVMHIHVIKSTAFCPLSLLRSCFGTSAGEIKNSIAEFGSGAYLGEDDIVRFEDHYGRAT
ncbi:mannose-6-phosphate isomerase, partial [Nitrosomonas nitrosa]